jgi:PST family polysaccharide transporter
MTATGSARSLAARAVSGAAWTIGTGVGSRALGLVGTLVVTYFVSREALGEVSDAAVAVLLANQVSTVGVGPYYLSRPGVGRDVAWHATVVHVALGVLAIAALLTTKHSLSIWMRAPGLELYLPGLALSGLLERFAYMPERVLARGMRFRLIGLCRTAAELSYTTASVALAAAGWGGEAIVAGNVARSVVRIALLAAVVPRVEWAAPHRLSASTMASMLRFGVPMSLGTAAGFASRRVDNAIVSGLFGPGVVGAYNLAYNVADVPAVQVGEQIGDVLLPSFVHMPREARKASLVRSTGLLALVTFPLAVGLGAVARTLVEVVLRPEWRDVGPMLAVLSVLSVVRPVGWTISAYLLAENRPGIDAALEGAKLAALVLLLLTVGRSGPLAACVAVGLAFAMHAVASIVVVDVLDGIPASAFVARCGPPFAACSVMFAAVAAARTLLLEAGEASHAVILAVQIAVGAATYAGAALVFARSMALDVATLVQRAIRERAVRHAPG